MASVEKRLADCQKPLCTDTHGQKCLTAKKDVLHGVQEVWEDDDIELAFEMNGIVYKNKTEERDITNSKSNQTLLKCRLDVRLFEDNNG